MDYVVESRARIPEDVRHGMRLGRNIRHDPRSLQYRVAEAVQATTFRLRHIPIVDQGDLGSCTGQAETGALGSDGIYETLPPAVQQRLDKSFAERLYSLATQLDPYEGTWEPDDTGSDGLSVSKAAKQKGLISGYVHALSVDDIINGLQRTAGIIGINWYSSFDDPTGGVLELPRTATLRGGHELHALNVDMATERFELPNSWGPGWGVNGVCYLPFTVMERLLHEDGDATFPVPVTQPPPTPVAPDRVEKTFTAKQYAAIDEWAGKPHVWRLATAAASSWKAAV